MNPITVSELNRYVDMYLKSNETLSSVCVTGEISKLSRYDYCSYLTLKDETGVISAVISTRLLRTLNFALENGMKVICTGSVGIYCKNGNYQLTIQSIQPDGIGALTIAFEQLKKQLQQEGLFEESHKKPLPVFPKRIGVITSPKGAAVRDILSVLDRRYPLAEVVFFPSLVQGDGAAKQLIQGVRLLDEKSSVDVIIIGRGGGSIEDLWCFNDEQLARAIYKANTPIISAVGHEVDFTICDFVADYRAATPTMAAEVVAMDMISIQNKIQKSTTQLYTSLSSYYQTIHSKLELLQNRPCLKDPLSYIEKQKMNYTNTVKDFINISNRNLQLANTHLSNTIGKLDALSPLKVLERGYSIATKNGKSIVHTSEVNVEDTISLRLSDGNIICQVKEK